MACKEGSNRNDGCNGCYPKDTARADIPWQGGCFEFVESGGKADELADYLLDEVRPALRKEGFPIDHKR